MNKELARYVDDVYWTTITGKKGDQFWQCIYDYWYWLYDPKAKIYEY